MVGNHSYRDFGSLEEFLNDYLGIHLESLFYSLINILFVVSLEDSYATARSVGLDKAR